MIQEFDLPLKDHFIFATSPLSLNNQWKKSKKAFKTFAYEYQFHFLNFIQKYLNFTRRFNKVRLPKDLTPHEFADYDETNLAKYEEIHHSIKFSI